MNAFIEIMIDQVVAIGHGCGLQALKAYTLRKVLPPYFNVKFQKGQFVGMILEFRRDW
jgi:hypothetical protein